VFLKILKKSFGAPFGGRGWERHPPNATQIKHVHQTLNPASFGDATEDAHNLLDFVFLKDGGLFVCFSPE
jgi:hypothetical protein